MGAQTVAVKVLDHKQLREGPDGGKEMLEALLSAHVDHPNIVSMW